LVLTYNENSDSKINGRSANENAKKTR